MVGSSKLNSFGWQANFFVSSSLVSRQGSKLIQELVTRFRSEAHAGVKFRRRCETLGYTSFSIHFTSGEMVGVGEMNFTSG